MENVIHMMQSGVKRLATCRSLTSRNFHTIPTVTALWVAGTVTESSQSTTPSHSRA